MKNSTVIFPNPRKIHVTMGTGDMGRSTTTAEECRPIYVPTICYSRVKGPTIDRTLNLITIRIKYKVKM